jgi:hypothetical protein
VPGGETVRPVAPPAAGDVSRTRLAGARRHVAVGALLLVAWQVAAVLGAPRRTGVVLGLHGFVPHTVAGKAYALVPAYFDRSLAVPRAPAASLPLLTLGGCAPAAAPIPRAPAVLAVAGAVAGATGAVVLVGALAWSVRDNLAGRETGTGEADADRRRVDRLADAFVPVVLASLLAGAYETVAVAAGLPTLAGRGAAGASHLLAAGVGALPVLAIGFRLLPRLLASSPPPAPVAVVLPAGGVGPALVAGTLRGPRWFRVGAAEDVAVVGFALAVLVLHVRSDRRRVGLRGPCSARWRASRASHSGSSSRSPAPSRAARSPTTA